MWLTSSSIGRKFVMALTGICLVLFVTFHVLMNSVALLWPTAYNTVCAFLGANWYALAASAGLAVLFIIHIIYAIWLTLQNIRARGHNSYAISCKAPGVEWSSKNMFILGLVVLAFIGLHLWQFWAKMQLQELLHHELSALPTVANVPAAPEFGTLFLQSTFEQLWVLPVYILWFVALWFHMNHGFWSMFQSIGWNNGIWLSRLKKISFWWTSAVIALFLGQAVLFSIQAHNKFFLTDPELQEQYAEFWAEKGTELTHEYQNHIVSLQEDGDQAIVDFFDEYGDYYIAASKDIIKGMETQAPLYPIKQQEIKQFYEFLQYTAQRTNAYKAQQNAAQTRMNAAQEVTESNNETNE